MQLLKNCLTLITLFIFLCASAQKHPIVYCTKSDIIFIKSKLNDNELIKKSYSDIKASVDFWIDKDVDVPFPKDPAGGYTHEKHKDNYTLMFNSSMLYQLTGQEKYADLVKKLFMKYAALNPTLKNHPEAKSKYPGHIFHQALNDANWLVYAGLAFDGIYNYLTASERKQIADGVLKPEVDFFTGELKDWFALIHNHAVWACAGVGIAGIATDNDDWVDKALYGGNKDRKSGFVANIDGLFSPEGFYTEGPYYTRYSLLPFFLFANSLQHYKPELKVFNRKNNVLLKSLYNALQQTNLDGSFYCYNDALKDKTFITNEIVEAVDIAREVFGEDKDLLPVVVQQKRVTLSRGGISLAEEISRNKNIPRYYPYQSIEFTDGANGDEGGVSILRSGANEKLTSLIFKYTGHGLSHGHFDKLNINLFDEGNEIITDYGAVRFVNIEQKYGGRYLPETITYSSQTIAHNTIVADEKSHFNAVEDASQAHHSNKLFSSIGGNVQVVSALDTNAYQDIKLHRTIYMLQLPNNPKPLTVDIFRAVSATQHQFDLPFQYSGTLMSTSFPYKTFGTNQTTMGKKFGYQHLWKEAEGKYNTPLAQFTFLNDKTYYSISSLSDDSTQFYFTRIGANDPNFNLRREPAYLIRKKGNNQTFINVLEIHGGYNSVTETSTNAYSSVKKITLLRNDPEYSVAEVMIGEKPLLLIQCNSNYKSAEKHNIIINNKALQFAGPFVVLYDGKEL